VTCWGTRDHIGLLLWFIYDSTSHHYNFYNFFSQCALFTSVLILYLGWSSDCWLLGGCSNLFLWSPPDIASLIRSYDLPLTLHLWPVPLICFYLPGFYSLPPWSRVLAPQIEDTLLKGYFSSATQRCCCFRIQQFGLCCSGKTLFEPLTSNAHICLSDVTCILEVIA
jgi:hypothetical protein